MPITAAAGGADANCFGMGGGVTGLNALIVADCDDGAFGWGIFLPWLIACHEDGADGDALLSLTLACFFDCCS